MGQEKVGRKDEAVIKAMGAFGGGIASTGRVCGALLGGVALISSLYSRGNLEESEDRLLWRLSYKLSKKFEDLTAEYGSVNCRDIARVNWSNKEEARDFYTNPESRRKLCAQLVGETAFMLGELLESAG